MSRTLVVATGNLHKVEEFAHILAPAGWQIKALGDLVPDFPEPEETAAEFSGNARIKAEAAHSLLPPGSWVVADDSGLAVDLLGGDPGVYSARFAQRAGHGSGDAANRTELALRLRQAGLSGSDTTAAAFICALHLIGPEGEIAVLGRCPGAVGLQERGEGGFGYDSLFFPRTANGDLERRTFAEMGEDSKNTLSHRGLALAELERRLAHS